MVGSVPIVARTVQLAALGESFRSFFHSIDQFFAHLAAVHWGSLLLGLAAFSGYLGLRSRALLGSLRAAYPDARIGPRRVFGAYVAAVGFKNIVPAGGANIIQLFLTRSSIAGSTFPAVGAALSVGALFDAGVMVLVMIYALTQGVFPKPPDFSKLHAFDLTFFASHFELTLFILTALALVATVLVALLSVRAIAFWARVRQGFAILRDRRRYRDEVARWQAGAWLCRLGAYWFMLDAFGIGGSLRNVLLVQGVQVVATIVPLTPGGAGVQQALLLAVFSGAASASKVAAYSVGQQIALAGFSLALGFASLVFIFHVRSFREVIRVGREQQEAESEASAPT